MKRFRQYLPLRALLGILLLTLLVTTLAAQQVHVVPAGPLSPAEQLTKFHLPPGFEIELVASEPEIQKPLSLNFDAAGRLLICDTVEYPFPPNGPGRDSLKRLEDRDGDGRYETVGTMVDRLSMPCGAEPMPDGVIVFTIPSIVRCWDEDDDGRVDRRKTLYTGFGMVDTHGMNNGFTRWLDGWIYACHGFRNDSTVAGSDGQAITMNSGAGYRFRDDGSHLEYVWHGQVNPYGMAFDSLGNIFTADCHSKPVYCLLRGAYYPSFGKPHDGLGFGPPMIEHTHGSTAISGIVYYDADQFPEEYRDTVFMGNCVTGRVNHDRVTFHGSSLHGEIQPDFVWCEDPWFRPVELKLGPDGALYIADFYNCIIGHYEVSLTHPRRDRQRGRVWRVSYKGLPGEEPRRPLPVDDLTTLTLTQLWDKLADQKLAVRLPATNEMLDRFGRQAIEPVATGIVGPSTASQRAHGLWILERLGELDDSMIERMADDPDRLVRVHLVKALAERPEQRAHVPLIRRMLFDPDGFVRRAAADALGRHPTAANVGPLLRLWVDTPSEDDYLIHTIRMTLRDHLQRPEVFATLADVLDDGDHTGRLLDVMPGIQTESSAAFVLDALLADKHDRASRDELIHYVARYVAADRADDARAYALRWRTSEPAQQAAVLRAYFLGSRERGQAPSAEFQAWAKELAEVFLDDPTPGTMAAGMQFVIELRVGGTYERLARVVMSPDQAVPLRIAALEACFLSGQVPSVEFMDAILDNPKEPLGLRAKSAEGLSYIATPTARERLLERLKTVDHRLAVEVAVALARTPEGSQLLLTAVEEGAASARLLQDNRVILLMAQMAHVLAVLEPDVQARIVKLTKDLPPADEAITKLVNARRQGFHSAAASAKRGLELFTEHCAICHLVEDEGTEIGPQLDGVGHRGADRLLEDVLDPSRNVDPLFRTTIILTDDGLTHQGLKLRDEGRVVILADDKGKERRIDMDTIDEQFTSPASPMPLIASETIPEADFYQILAYLLTLSEQPRETAPEGGDSE